MRTTAKFVASLALASLCASAMAVGSYDDPRAKASNAPGAADMARGRAALTHKDWPEAVNAFEKVTAQDPRNADAWNWLAYANRKNGKLDAAFKYYDKALSLDPKHRGAYEYQGEAFLMANKPDKAEANLATLAKLCNSQCEEYQDLKAAITAYKTGKR
ncbi:tetratricopeptide repeat protein [Uliginosibacterium sp. H3]|uniref:Tetratricopeptide repeat protein n=1 Tax=Uliginosibacterium silvisoli TaxID=3114758 RepID=A0ABU6JYH5_9RHOO|nr:tetratricopeptide repeat protein [Uliginosibacterium sp. H3]